MNANRRIGPDLSALYFLAQGVLIWLWWFWLQEEPETRKMFFAGHTREEMLRLFYVADVFVLAPLSVLAGIFGWKNGPFRACFAFAAAGAALYSWMAALTVNAPIGTAWLADIAMTVCAACSSLAALRAWKASKA